MASKKKSKTDIQVQAEQKAELLRRADLSLRPSLNAAAVIADFGTSFGEQDFPSLVESLAAAVSEVCEGDMTRCEAMLMAQAQALQSIFVNLACRASKQENLTNIDGLMRLALKAQNQCRATIETLSAVKNPPIVYAQQANIAQNQQVNNGIPANTVPSCAREEKIIPTNELLEAHDGEWLDTRAKSKAGDADTAMATLEPIHRAENKRRKKQFIA